MQPRPPRRPRSSPAAQLFCIRILVAGYLMQWEKDPSNPINFTGGPQTGGANAGSIWWNDKLNHFNLLALSHSSKGSSAASLATTYNRHRHSNGNEREPLTTGSNFRYETTDATFHNWTRTEVFSSHGGEGGQWFMRLPPTVDGAPPPPGTPTHIITSGDGGQFAFGDYDKATDQFTPSVEWGTSNFAAGPVNQFKIGLHRESAREH